MQTHGLFGDLWFDFSLFHLLALVLLFLGLRME